MFEHVVELFIRKDMTKKKDIGTDSEPSNVDSTLEERGSRYGEFQYHAEFSRALLRICQEGLSLDRGDVTEEVQSSWNDMQADQQEGLVIIMHKVARILNGDPHYSDSWHDIAGYAQLVDKRLKKEGK